MATLGVERGQAPTLHTLRRIQVFTPMAKRRPQHSQGEAAVRGKFAVGNVYYQCGFASSNMAPWKAKSAKLPWIGSWVYAGYHKLLVGSRDCDEENHFLVFQPFGELENVLHWPPEKGLKIPSLAQAEESMLTFSELMAYLPEIQQQMHDDVKGSRKTK